MVIYKITCTGNGKIYIGSAVNFNQRKRQHLCDLRMGVHKNRYMQYAFNLYGESEFLFEIVESVDSKELLLEREQFWLDFTQCCNREIGFNINPKAESSIGLKRSEEFKEKIRQANLNRSDEIKKKTVEAVKKANSGKPSWNKGKKLGKKKPEHTNLGKKFPKRKLSAEHYAKVCEANRRPRSQKFHELRSFLSSKSYYFIGPHGGEIKVENLKEFCLKAGLNPSRMYQVAKGKEPQHKGWQREELCYKDYVEE